jgi:hypothetical protein
MEGKRNECRILTGELEEEGTVGNVSTDCR